jgi:hypothetical protein
MAGRKWVLAATVGAPIGAGAVTGMLKHSVIWGGAVAFSVVIATLLIAAPIAALVEARRSR